MPKQLLFNEECRKKIQNGVNTLANAVKVTLGPCGRNVAYEWRFGGPKVTKDGVTVAKEVMLSDPFENMGSQMVKEVAAKTAEIAGDGTTTATILAQAIFREGNKYVASGANPMTIKRSMEKAANAVIAEIKRRARPITNGKELEQVATVSANWDHEIGQQIATAINKVGSHGVITVEEARGIESSIEIVEGISFDRGYLSPYFINDPEKSQVVMEKPVILLYDKKLQSMKSIYEIASFCAKGGKPLVIISDDIDNEMLATLAANKMRGTMSVVALKAPAYGDRRKAILEDIAIATGGTLISEDAGMKIEQATIDDCGSADKIIITKDKTSIIKGYGSSEAIAARVKQIEAQLASTTSVYDTDNLKERLAKLTLGVAIIKVGAATETELKEKRDRIDDALHATRAAMEEGIVPGGGVALLKASHVVAQMIVAENDFGAIILHKALEEPIKAILTNAGIEHDMSIIKKIYNLEIPAVDPSLLMTAPAGIAFKPEADTYFMGYDGRDLSHDNLIDMYQTGIIDPAKVVRCALQNAVSIAGLMLTTECMISFDEEERKKDPFAPQK